MGFRGFVCLFFFFFWGGGGCGGEFGANVIFRVLRDLGLRGYSSFEV